MKKTLTFLFLLTTLSLSAQIKFYVEGGLNTTLISSSSSISNTKVESDLTGYDKFQSDFYLANYNNLPGGMLGAGMNYPIFDDLSFDVGLRFNNYNYNEKIIHETSYIYHKQNSTDTMIPWVDPIKQSFYTKQNTLWLGIPIGLSYYLYGTQFAVGLAIMPTYLLYNQTHSNPLTELNKTVVAMEINLRYQFTDSWWLQIGFQEYSSRMYKRDFNPSLSNMRDLYLSVRYDLPTF